jgi:5-methylcytosine-specific restriction endonuclease McrA
MIYKRCSRCGKRIPSGTTCECLKQRHKEYDKYSRDKQSDAFYHSNEWILTRDEVLRIDKGIDVYIFMTTGEIVAADTVHHVIEFKTDKTKALDINNLISLSNSTHAMIHQLYKKDKEKIQQILFSIIKQYRDREQ